MELNEPHLKASHLEKEMLEKHISLEQHHQILTDIRRYWIEAYREDIEVMKARYERTIGMWERSAYLSLIFFFLAFFAYVFK